MIWKHGAVRRNQVFHFGQDEHRENIVCGTWRGEWLQWTDIEWDVTCRECRKVLNPKKLGSSSTRSVNEKR